MKILAVDIGNSKIAACLVTDGRASERFLGWSPLDAPAQQRAAEICDWCAQQIELEGERSPVGGLGLCSVVPPVRELFVHLWRSRPATRRTPLHVVDATSPLAFAPEVESLETVGADRLCNVAGAMALGYPSALIVDLGTANTYDLLWEGCFLGGLIAPGCQLAHAALLRTAAQLPELPFGRPEGPQRGIPGRNTAQAIRAGSFHQAVGGVVYLVAQVRSRWQGIPVLLAGGMAELVGPELEPPVIFHPELTLEGAAAIASRALQAQ